MALFLPLVGNIRAHDWYVNRIIPAFLLSIPFEGHDFCYVITALHTIHAIKKESLDKRVYLRINNTKGGFSIHQSRVEDWYCHPEHTEDEPIDVAVLPIGWTRDNCDYLFRAIPLEWITKLKDQENEFGLGDELTICGLFRYSEGSQKNEPVVRVGNIAGIPNEKVMTRWNGKKRRIDAFLIEARSIGGMSGSPVLINYGEVRIIRGSVMASPAGPVHGLLGLIHGHWDQRITDLEFDMASEMGREERLNVGIAMVTPCWRISQTLGQPDLEANRKSRSNYLDKE